MDAFREIHPAPHHVSFHVPWSTAPLPRPLRIMIVDHDRRAAETIQRQLLSVRQHLDDNIRTVSQGLEALSEAEQFQPELVIVSLGLPRRSGMFTARLLRGRAWAGQVVIVSHSIGGSETDETPPEADFHFFSGLDVQLLVQMVINLRLRRSSLNRLESVENFIGENFIGPPRIAPGTKRTQEQARTA